LIKAQSFIPSFFTSARLDYIFEIVYTCVQKII
jgi:hypothetical protein